ncbi:isoaspartyl peptidase/L-asparaginase family protein [Limnohabitans sp. 63ED37-2]|uniref:isoaspartyl peptidase/L-asparaginase family protein n=1 Tax=Limnohabitans sp. 63ED37-2 TaxID=1678128 RepID=UPI000705D58B|nr:isoaspartyl peptidase/L-asparaginase [Limnohabitans sp. 63ED37-2]ALK88442.1 Isoaspartyl peptidase precursor [Limnohabitans sp. 63ED37-2]
MQAPVTLLVHGGAGTLTRVDLSAAQEREYRDALGQALRAGQSLLLQGGTALDAAVAAVCVLEDCPLFNAGKGSVFTHEGRNEMDAAVMDGATGQAGAVAGVVAVRNPILAAQAVMQRSGHVFLLGQGAEAFARAQGLALEGPGYFHTEHRWQQLQAALAQNQVMLDHDGQHHQALPGADPLDRKFGTVGAVALDAHGHLAAATSTGGMTNKMFGRVGDSPLIGAGTYACDDTAAVSATGAGEFFIRGVVAHDIAARMAYGRLSLAKATQATMRDKLDATGGRGGVIALDRHGHYKLAFNTEGMYRGVVQGHAQPQVAIYRA